MSQAAVDVRTDDRRVSGAPPRTQNGRPTRHRVIPLLFRFTAGHRGWFVAALVALVIEAITSVFEPYPIGYLIDFLRGDRGSIAFPGINSPRISTVAVLTIAIIVLAVVNKLADSLAEVYLARGGRMLGYNMRVGLYSHLQRLSLAFHTRRRTGDMLKRVTSDVEVVEEFVTTSLSDLTGSVLVLTGTLIFLFTHSWQVAVLAVVLVPILSFVSHRFSQRIIATSRRQRAREGELASAAQEMLTSVPVVQSYGRGAYEGRRFARYSRRAMSAALQAAVLEAKFSWVVGVMEAITISAVVWLGLFLVDRGALSVGTMVLFIILIQNMFKPTRRIIKEWTRIGKTYASIERVADVLARRPSVGDMPGARRAEPFRGEIEFRHVTFGYRPDPEDAPTDPDGSQIGVALDDLSFHVRPGEVVALVGPSGGGKSTIAQLIPRLYDPDEGQVLIDGNDIKSFTLDSLRSQISLVLQDTILFSGTVAHNITYGRSDATREQGIEAAIQANAHEFIHQMPNGYDTELSERAANLSGGQKQRIAIARALVRGAPILLLDEPTTGLDAESTQLVFQALRRLMKGKTTITISHDLELIRTADRILVIRGGRVEQMGTHDELMREGGLYASLYARRFADTTVDAEASTEPVLPPPVDDGEGRGRQIRPGPEGHTGTGPGMVGVRTRDADAVDEFDGEDLLRSPALSRELPGLHQAFDERAMHQEIRRMLVGDAKGRYTVTQCKRAQAVYTPEADCLVRYRIGILDRRTGDAFDELVIGHVFPDVRAAEAYHRNRLLPLAADARGRPELASFEALAATITPMAMTLSVFPVDGELPTLVPTTDPATALEVLREALPDARAGRMALRRCRVEVHHYGRQRRCLLRYTAWPTLPSDEEMSPVVVFGKVAGDDRGALALAVTRALKGRVDRGSNSFIVPRSFDYVAPLRLLLMEAIPGEPRVRAALAGSVGSGAGSASHTLERDIETGARVAAGFHTSGISLGPHRGIEGELAELREAALALDRHSPRLGARFAEWLGAVTEYQAGTDPLPACSSHGDFTHSQLIFSESRCGLVDFDTVCQAEPALDLGQFLAYLRLGARKVGLEPSANTVQDDADRLAELFVETYVEARGYERAERQWLTRRVRLYELVSLLRLGFHSWQKFKARRLLLVRALIQERLADLGR